MICSASEAKFNCEHWWVQMCLCSTGSTWEANNVSQAEADVEMKVLFMQMRKTGEVIQSSFGLRNLPLLLHCFG